MSVDAPHLLLALLVPLLAAVVSALVLYPLVRLAVRHGSLDARRRWRDEAGGGPGLPGG